MTVDDITARRLTTALDAAQWDDETRDGMLDLIERATTLSPALIPEGAELLGASVAIYLQQKPSAAGLLAAAALMNRAPKTSSVRALADKLTKQPPHQLGFIVSQADERLSGPMRGVALEALRALASSPRNVGSTAEATADAIAMLDPEGLAQDVADDDVASAIDAWMQADPSHLDTVRTGIDHAGFDDRQQVSLEEVGVAEVSDVRPVSEAEPDRYLATVRFDVTCRVSEPPDEDNLDGYAEADPEHDVVLVARLRRRADSVDVQIEDVEF